MSVLVKTMRIPYSSLFYQCGSVYSLTLAPSLPSMNHIQFLSSPLRASVPTVLCTGNGLSFLPVL